LIDDAPMPNVEQLPKDMRKSVGRQAESVGYRTFVFALALILVAISAFAKGGRSPSRLRVHTPPPPEAEDSAGDQAPPRQTLPHQAPPRTQILGGHVYHGQLGWRDGRWHHITRDGRQGWWWDVGGYSYYYPEQTEGPPDYVSDVEIADDAPVTPSDTPSPPAT